MRVLDDLVHITLDLVDLDLAVPSDIGAYFGGLADYEKKKKKKNIPATSHLGQIVHGLLQVVDGGVDCFLARLMAHLALRQQHTDVNQSLSQRTCGGVDGSGTVLLRIAGGEKESNNKKQHPSFFVLNQ